MSLNLHSDLCTHNDTIPPLAVNPSVKVEADLHLQDQIDFDRIKGWLSDCDDGHTGDWRALRMD
jgi:hypothetical protein